MAIPLLTLMLMEDASSFTSVCPAWESQSLWQASWGGALLIVNGVGFL